MDEQTRKLYEECNTGCQMAIESMQQIKDFTQDTTLFQLIEKYIDRHSRLGGNAKDHLIDSGNEVKAPGMMASAFSWFSTELKLNLNDDNSKIAKLLIDGCSMGKMAEENVENNRTGLTNLPMRWQEKLSKQKKK